MVVVDVSGAHEDAQPEMRQGDVVQIELNTIVTEKDIALIMVGNEILIRRIKRYVSGVFLIPINNTTPPEFYSMEEMESMGLKILGKITEITRKY